VNPSTYVERDGKRVLDHTRDGQYTRELGDVVMEHYLRDTVAMPTHVVATAAFALLRKRTPNADLFALVRRRDEVVVPWRDFVEEIERTQRRLLDLEARGAIVLSTAVRGATATELLNDAERALNGYHTHPIIRSREQGVALLDPKVLLYYQNRLAAHGVAWEGGIATR
jgi:glycerol-3-phosphate O-acyltransferase